ncbi:hypothetical protein J7E55_11960 [Bacillus sp. ISL-53]|nr:hypothetical protein [Bacillus sp. ISL-53]
MIKDWLTRLTDNIKKNSESNIGKLLSIADSEIEQLKNTLLQVEEWRNIHNAQGVTLDLMGENVGQPRGKASDDIYRVLIRGKDAQGLADGTINKIIHILSITLDCDPSDINIVSQKENGGTESAALIIRKVPLDALNKVGLSPIQFGKIAEKTVAGGVRLALIDMQGTFRFSSQRNEIETSPDGFSSNGTDGGTLGSVYTPGDEVDLPI